MGHRCTLGHCTVGRRFSSGSGPRWMEEGKLLSSHQEWAEKRERSRLLKAALP